MFRRREPDAHWAPRQPERSVLAALGGNWLLIIGFALVIAVGTLVLRTPWAGAATTLTWSEALFTSTSAVTVTGLTVVNTANDLSLFGQVTVLVLMQIGGAGFVAFSVLLFRLIGRRVTLETRFLARQTLGVSETSGIVPLTLYVLGITIAAELLGAALLFARWQGELPIDQAAYFAVFHAVSAYCNAGFDLFAGTDHGTLFGYGSDPYTLGVMAALIIAGGLGVTVLYDVWSYRADRQLSLHTKLTLVMTVLLTAGGFAFLLTDRGLMTRMLGAMPPLEQGASALFTIISARTAGITILPIEGLTESSQLLIMVWMFVGGAPASMAGGVSTATAAVILVAVYATTRGETEANAFGRTIPTETLFKAMAVMTVSTVAVAASTLALVDQGHGPVFPVAFEVVSAFSNTGYSVGAGASESLFGRILIVLLMFWGRVGPLTIVVALAERAHPSLIRYPEEPIILG